MPCLLYELSSCRFCASLSAFLALNAASWSSTIDTSTSSFRIFSWIKLEYSVSDIGVTGLHLESSQLVFCFVSVASPVGIELRIACPVAPNKERTAIAGRMLRGPPSIVSACLCQEEGKCAENRSKTYAMRLQQSRQKHRPGNWPSLCPKMRFCYRRPSVELWHFVILRLRVRSQNTYLDDRGTNLTVETAAEGKPLRSRHQREQNWSC